MTKKQNLYATPGQLIERYGKLTDTVGRTEIADALEQAHRELELTVERWHYDKRRYDDDTTTYDLEMHPVLRFVDVITADPDEDLTEGTDYTVNKENAEVTITSTGDDKIGDTEPIAFVYVPQVYQDLEVKLAIRRLVQTSKVTTGADDTQEQLDVLDQDINQLVNKINGYNTVMSGADNNRGRHYRWP